MKKQKVKLEALEVKSFTTSEKEEAVKGGATITSCGIGGICTLLTGCFTGGGMTQCTDSNDGKICY